MERRMIEEIKAKAQATYDPKTGNCCYCQGEEDCPAVDPAGIHLLCTLDVGHKGPHIACGWSKESHAHSVWED